MTVTLERNVELIAELRQLAAEGKSKSVAERCELLLWAADKEMLRELLAITSDCILRPAKRGKGRPKADEVGGFQRLIKEQRIADDISALVPAKNALRKGGRKATVGAARTTAADENNVSEGTARRAYYARRKIPNK